MPTPSNPLLNDRDVEFLLYEVLDAAGLCDLPAFADHSRETFDLFLGNARRLARDVVFPTYKPMDESPPVLRDGAMYLHPLMKTLYPRLRELGVLNATRPQEVGGVQLPQTISAMAGAYLSAGNMAALGVAGITTGAAHLIEAFGNEHCKREFMTRMYSGEWTGTMALTEPHAGSSLADVTSRARPRGDGTYEIQGSKIFISGGDHDLTDNIVHMTLARIEGAPAGIKGVSLFAVPKKRQGANGLEPNDVSVAGAIHKIGWRGFPSLAMNFGEKGDCRGWLVGTPNRGIAHMFQMMNEARILVGVGGAASALVAYHEAVAYARDRTQGRAITTRDPATPQVPIIEHADVRRMLLRSKAIAEGALALVTLAARYQDLSLHASTEAERARAQLLLDLLTPVAKSFPAEKGYEVNVLAVQIHGGYGYSSEYLPEAWMRDQKLNSIHEGTTGIQGLDLLGRKVVAGGGAALQALLEEIQGCVARARTAGVPSEWCDRVAQSADTLGGVTMELAQAGLGGEVERMLRHSADYLDLCSTVVVAWLWLWQASAAQEGLARGRDSLEFYQGKLCAAQYWFHTELPRVEVLATLCRSGEDSYARMQPGWF